MRTSLTLCIVLLAGVGTSSFGLAEDDGPPKVLLIGKQPDHPYRTRGGASRGHVPEIHRNGTRW
jgi:hypothetical protein